MGANSVARRMLKRALFPVFGERSYRFAQAAAMAWDIRMGPGHEPELALLPHAIRPGETALDIGANYGFYTYHISKAVGREGRVYAFEPIPFTCETLRVVINILRLRNVQVVSKGCSNVAGDAVFRVPVQHSGAISAGQACLDDRHDDHPGKEAHVRWNQTREVNAELVCLDEMFTNIDRLSFIKCDIEGAELLAFMGAERLINTHHPTVLCEINPWFIKGFGLELSDLLDFFDSRSYQVFKYEQVGSGGRLKPVQESAIVEANYLFIHPSRLDRFITVAE